MTATPADPAPHSDAWRDTRASRSCRSRWTPVELVAMILGFIVFWPIGLAILGWKFWQRRAGYPGDLAAFADERMTDMRGMFRGCRAARRDGWAAARWGAAQGVEQGWPRGFGRGAQTGNAAFDEWKTAELARLEEERRKLEQAQQEFADYLAHLRKARDKEEFDRFVQERDSAKARGEAGWRPFPETGAAPPR